MSERLNEREYVEGSVFYELAQIKSKLDVVIDQHGTKIAESETLHKSADNQLRALRLDSNNHELRLSALEERTSGIFSRSWTIISGVGGIIALAFTWIKLGVSP